MEAFDDASMRRHPSCAREVMARFQCAATLTQQNALAPVAKALPLLHHPRLRGRVERPGSWLLALSSVAALKSHCFFSEFSNHMQGLDRAQRTLASFHVHFISIARFER
jgi:hypothetical protein